MTTEVLRFTAFIAVGELVIHILLFLISKFIGKPNRDKISRTSILKGVLERTFIVTSLHFNMTQSLTLLGALKIATRIKDTDDRVSNDFFLIGNLISVLFGIMYFIIYKDLVG